MVRKRQKLIATAMAVSALGAVDVAVSSAAAQECYLGDIKMFAGNFAPRGYALAQGQILPIAQNQSLYSLLGTTYGGDGRTSFALPDLRGRAPVGVSGAQRQGTQFGAEASPLSIAQLPAHSHTATTDSTLRATNQSGRQAPPAGNVLAQDGNDNIYVGAATNTTMAAAAISSATTVGNAGGSSPLNRMQPSLAVNYIVCLQGLFPSRN